MNNLWKSHIATIFFLHTLKSLMEASLLFPFFLFVFFSKFFSEGECRELRFVHEPVSYLVSSNEVRKVFRCTANPRGVEVTWLMDNQSITPNGHFIIHSNRLVVQLSSASSWDDIWSRTFRCVARYHDTAIISLPAKLIQAKLDDFPKQESKTLKVIAGSSAVITCSLPHGVPVVLAEFLFQGQKIDLSSSRYRLLKSLGNLHISDVRPEDEGTYQCVAFNPFLGIRKRDKKVTKLIVSDSTLHQMEPPKFIAISQKTISAVLSTNVTLECAATGFPPPKIHWIRLDGQPFPPTRFQIHGGILEIFRVEQKDKGTYVCQASNGVGTDISISTVLEIEEPARITSHPPLSQEVREGSNVTLMCGVTGHPLPEVSWYHNGLLFGKDSKFENNVSHLDLWQVSSKQAGIYQCFASNYLGTTYATSHLSFSTVSSEDYEYEDYEEDEVEDHFNHNQSNKKNKKKTGGDVFNLVRPSQPQVTQISSHSVMLHWSLPTESGLPVSFFKVQYKGKVNPTGWITIDEDIDPKTFNYPLHNLRTGILYNFRVIAVYSNNDNLQSPKKKFTLKPNFIFHQLYGAPTLKSLETLGPTSIAIHWEYNQDEEKKEQIDGFIIYYRPSTTAGDYHQLPLIGPTLNSYVLKDLEPGTTYEIKLVAFNPHGKSAFSQILSVQTNFSSEPLELGQQQEVILTTLNKEDNFKNIPSINLNHFESKTSESTIGLVVGCTLTLTILTMIALLCFCSSSLRTTACFCCSAPLNKDSPGKLEQKKRITQKKMNITINPFTDIPSSQPSRAKKNTSGSYNTVWTPPDPESNGLRPDLGSSSNSNDNLQVSLPSSSH